MRNYIPEISRLIKNRKLTLFCGAGISKNSGLPLANELKQYILEKLPIDQREVDEIMNSALPFEAFMDSISLNTDSSKILDMFADGKPNANHFLIARLAKNGYLKTIFTTNFDLLIEKALESEGLKENIHFERHYSEEHFSSIDLDKLGDRTKIFKLHGSIDDEASIRTTLEAVASKALSDKRLRIVRYLFSTGRHEAVLILGYSNSDEFDITPQIQCVEDNQKEIGFVEHCKEENIEDIREKDFKNPFKKFPGRRIKCDTDKFIAELWNSLKDIIGKEYELPKSRVNWRRYVDDWANGLEEYEGYRKYSAAASIFSSISNFNRVIEYSNKTFKIAKARLSRSEKSRCYRELGNVYSRFADFNRAIKYHNKALKIAKAIRDEEGEPNCYVGLGNAYYGLGDFNRAIEYHDKALKIKKARRDKSGELTCYVNLGCTYVGLEDFKRVIEYSNKGLEIAIATGDKARESLCYVNLGSAYHGLEDFKRVIEYSNKGLEIAIAIEDRSEQSRCYTNLSATYNSLEDFKRAIEYSNKGLEIAIAIGDRTQQSKCHVNLGFGYSGLGDRNRAIEFYLNAEKIYKGTKQIHYLKLVYNNLSVCYRKIGDYKTAQKYGKLADSI